MKPRVLLSTLAIAPVLAVIAPATIAHAAVGISRAELSGGQLRVEGSGALPQHAITVTPGNVTGTSDSNGAYKIQASSYSSPTCKITVSDGSTSSNATLSGCTPTSTTPPPSTSGAAVTLQPASLTFPAETTGTTSPPQTVTLASTGSAPLFINGIQSSGVAALDYTIIDDQCSGVTIAVGGKCTLTIVFKPTADGTRSSSFVIHDNAANSPQAISVTGTGLGTGTGPTPLAINKTGMSCDANACDVTEGFGVIANNFYLTGFTATGGTAPYTWTATTAVPPGLTFKPNGVLSGYAPPTAGVYPFTLKVADSAGATTSQRFTLTVRPHPAAPPKGCQQGSTVRESLFGPAIGGKTPQGLAQEDESQLNACGGFGVLTASVTNVNLPDGTMLLVTLDGGGVGVITLSRGAGSMRPFVLESGLRFDHVTVLNGRTTILSGGSFG